MVYEVYNYYMTKQRIEEEEEHKRIICPNCGAVVRKGLEACPKCDALLWFEAISPSHQERLEEIEDSSYGVILLREKGYIFEKIYSQQELDPMIKYFSLYSLILSAIYGFFLGLFAGGWQIPVSLIKIPLLVFGTLLICLPALYILNTLVGTKLSVKQTLAMLLASTFLMTVVLGSLSPVILFFILLTSTKKFISVLNVFIFAISGIFALKSFWNGMRYLTIRSDYYPKIPVIKGWSLLYIAVGTQLAWILRPFIGDKAKFSLFREIEGNFYMAVFNMIADYFK